MKNLVSRNAVEQKLKMADAAAMLERESVRIRGGVTTREKIIDEHARMMFNTWRSLLNSYESTRNQIDRDIQSFLEANRMSYINHQVFIGAVSGDNIRSTLRKLVGDRVYLREDGLPITKPTVEMLDYRAVIPEEL